MKIINENSLLARVVDAKNYKWFFSDNLLFIWFDTEEIPRFLKYIRLRPYGSEARLYGTAPDMLGYNKRYYIGYMTEQQERQLEEIYGREKESFFNKLSETRNVQVEAEE